MIQHFKANECFDKHIFLLRICQSYHIPYLNNLSVSKSSLEPIKIHFLGRIIATYVLYFTINIIRVKYHNGKFYTTTVSIAAKMLWKGNRIKSTKQKQKSLTSLSFLLMMKKNIYIISKCQVCFRYFAKHWQLTRNKTDTSSASLKLYSNRGTRY